MGPHCSLIPRERACRWRVHRRDRWKIEGSDAAERRGYVPVYEMPCCFTLSALRSLLMEPCHVDLFTFKEGKHLAQ